MPMYFIYWHFDETSVRKYDPLVKHMPKTYMKIENRVWNEWIKLMKQHNNKLLCCFMERVRVK